MAKIGLLQAVCTVAMLAAGSAYAQQTETPAGTTGPNGAPNPTAHQPMSSDTGSSTGHSMHRSAMAHHAGGMHGRADTSQNGAVDQLNDQSYQAAQQGQTFNGSGSAPGSMPSNGSGSMSNMSSGGTMPGSTTTKP